MVVTIQQPVDLPLTSTINSSQSWRGSNGNKGVHTSTENIYIYIYIYIEENNG